MLICNAPGCRENQLPLILQPDETEFVESQFEAEQVKKILGKIDWPIMRNAVQKFEEGLPETVEAATIEEEEFLRKLHRFLFELHVNTG